MTKIRDSFSKKSTKVKTCPINLLNDHDAIINFIGKMTIFVGTLSRGGIWLVVECKLTPHICSYGLLGNNKI